MRKLFLRRGGGGAGQHKLMLNSLKIYTAIKASLQCYLRRPLSRRAPSLLYPQRTKLGGGTKKILIEKLFPSCASSVGYSLEIVLRASDNTAADRPKLSVRSRRSRRHLRLRITDNYTNEYCSLAGTSASEYVRIFLKHRGARHVN